MTTSSPAAGAAASLLSSRIAAALLGAFIIGVVGFSQVEAAHNAGHDHRHSMAFPCH